ncbi:hypothetical protein ACIOGZ_28505 [Kitasatospora sp. NPDC088160]
MPISANFKSLPQLSPRPSPVPPGGGAASQNAWTGFHPRAWAVIRHDVSG